MYEIFEHTADMGLRVRAASRAALHEEAALALTAIIVADPRAVRPVATETFQVRGAEPAYLLLDWLNELLYAFESRRMLFARFDVVVAGGELRAAAAGERYDPRRHALAHEVKAITYHGLEVAEADGEWTATVIVDI